ncbi:MAG: Crp/Fnr family transcriptional regulator [Bacteroidales bacterium]
MLTKNDITFDSLFNRCTLPINILLNDKEKSLILENINIVEYSRKDIILKQNSRTSHILYLSTGLVKISKELRKGKHLIMKLQNSGDFIGLSSILGGESFDYTVSAIDDCTAVYIDLNVFISILERNGLFCIDIARQISRNTLFNINRLSGLLYKQLPGRVADLILYFSNNIYHSNSFKFPLTRQELAELCGTTKESLIRTLSEFNHDRIIEMDRSSVKVISVDILKTLSRLG